MTYPLTTHWSWTVGSAKASRITGRAMLNIAMSMPSRKAAPQSATSRSAERVREGVRVGPAATVSIFPASTFLLVTDHFIRHHGGVEEEGTLTSAGTPEVTDC